MSLSIYGVFRRLPVATIVTLLCASMQVPSFAAPVKKKDVPPALHWEHQRAEMVDAVLEQRGIKDKRVLAAMRSVPRHLFAPPEHWKVAYEPGNIPIGNKQVMGDPYIVAFMTQALVLKPTDRVLEIGTGCGYHAAVLSKLVKQVYSIEIEKPLAESAAKRLRTLGYKNVEVKAGDGYVGWSDKAPFDAIVVTSFPDHIPKALVEQLKEGGRLVSPVGGKVQRLRLVKSTTNGIEIQDLAPNGLILVPRKLK